MTAMRRVFFSYKAEKKACEGPVMKKKHKRNALLAQGVLVRTHFIIRGCPACFLILKGVVISSHETNRFS